MKNILTILLLSIGIYAVQAQTTMNIYQSNGTNMSLPIATIDSMTFTTSQPPTLNIYQYGGGIIIVVLPNIDSITYTVTSNSNGYAVLSTLPLGNITNNSAVAGGNIVSDGGNPVTQRGVCWSTSPNPTIANSTTTDGSGIGNYTSTLSGLAANTTFYVRAYAINSAGTAYGNQLTFTTAGNPAGIITYLNCNGATNTGTLTSGTAASGVSSSVPYLGGNGGSYSAQSINSTGVTGLTVTLTAGNFASGSGTLVYIITGTPASSGTASFALSIGGQSCTLNLTVNAQLGSITFLDCSSSTNTGTLTSGTAASGVSSSVPYLGGNGGSYSAQSINSTGVTGLTATLTAGNLATGIGSLTYTITGTPSASGTASFNLNIGGQSCILNLVVNAQLGSITFLDCSSSTNTGTLTAGTAASGVSSSVPYTGGNGGTYSAQSINSTGVTGLTATLAAGSFISGSGTLNYSITGTPNTSGTASFALSIGGQTCILQLNINAQTASCTPVVGIVGYSPSSSNISCATNGQAYSQDISFAIPATVAGATITNAVIDSIKNLPTGLSYSLNQSPAQYSGGSTGCYRIHGTSNASCGQYKILVYATFNTSLGPISGELSALAAQYSVQGFSPRFIRVVNAGVACPAPDSTQTLNFVANSNCNSGSITALNCNSATNNGTLTAGIAASGVSSSVPYAGGNGGAYSTQSISSTGVAGLTATLAAGTFASGSGTLSYMITGTPSAAGPAIFALSIGGQACTLSRTVNAPIGSITSLNCISATHSGTLTASTAAVAVSSSVPYTGGNGGTYNAQSVSSTGVTGLTATLVAGTFVSGNGNLTYTITGTPSASGTASFALSIGGQNCNLNRAVVPLGTVVSNPGVGVSYGGYNYPTIVLGNGQEWMAENLRTTTYANGDPIPNVTGAWENLGTGAWAYYANDPQYQNHPYGKLYNWYAVTDPRNVCPTGWHMPSNAEWNTLISYLDPFYSPNATPQSTTAGGKMKSSGTSYWLAPNGFATNESGFSGLPSGLRSTNGGSFGVGSIGVWWASDNYSATGGRGRKLISTNGEVTSEVPNKWYGCAVRCVKD